MDNISWKNAVLDVVRRVSDEFYQRAAWFGDGPIVSSPEEIYCELFDDLMYEDFLISTDVPMNEEQRSLGLMLRDALNQYADSFDQFVDPGKVFHDAQWAQIRSLAKDYLDAFR
jgi:hypothetical protein